MMKRRCNFMFVLLFIAIGSTSAQEALKPHLDKISEMLLSTANYSAELSIKYYKSEEILKEKNAVLFKTDDLFYRKMGENETILNKENYLHVDHQKKQILLLSSQVATMNMAVMGFDSKWMAKEDLEVLAAPQGKVKIRVPNYQSYKEVIYTFDNENYCLIEIDYISKEISANSYSRVKIVYHNTRFGDQVIKKFPVYIHDYVRFKRGKWNSQLKNYKLINHIKE